VEQKTAPPSDLPNWTREAGAQPIPGYRLIEPLGRGGFGEVWKCEAPGGLFKAMKFVKGQDDPDGAATQELEALQRVKAIRHPFILSLERVEVLDGVLVIVMELADQSLNSLLDDYQAQDLPGIPREELLGYLLEAAEALDWMNFGHGLQHLDIKPHNLFLVSNHVKVADFGLVDSLGDAQTDRSSPRRGGVTPLYAAPELLRGAVSRQCDQYSLAIVYQQLLTGTVPFWSSNTYQLMLLHLSAAPNLTPLSAEDRPTVARALAKTPEDRFPSCSDFLQALICGAESTPRTPKKDLSRRNSAVQRAVATLRADDKKGGSPSQPSEKPTKSLRRHPAAEPGDVVPAVPGSENPARTPPNPTNSRTIVHTSTASASPSTGEHPVLPRTAGAAGSSAAGYMGNPEPTCVSLPGYRFLRCTAQTPLGDVWRAQDDRGRACRALCLYSFVEQDPTLIPRLGALRHPALPPAEFSWSPAGRLVLITDEFQLTLRDRFEACQKAGQPGIPRAEMLVYLRTAAEALDALQQQHGLPHLALNPRTLVLQDGQLWLTDFALVSLIWLPMGQSVTHINGRYAAPELFERPVPPTPEAPLGLGRAGPASDQFSLALIYAEMLSGVAPRAGRPGSGVHRRPGTGSPRKSGDSGGHPVVRPASQNRIDLDLISARDREVLVRALQDDPEQRFPSCTALVEALEAASPGVPRPEDLYCCLPPVIPFTSLMGEPPPPGVSLPTVQEFVLSLATPTQAAGGPPRSLLASQNVRYVMQASDVWECKCPVKLFSGALRLKMEAFCNEWQARIIHEKEDSFIFQITSVVRGSASAQTFRLLVELDVPAARSMDRRLSEARIRIRPANGEREQAAHLMGEVAPRVFDSLRNYLQAGPEQRGGDRWQCPQPLHVYPILPNLEMEEVVEGISRNVSLGGVSFRVSRDVRTEQVYLHWHKSPSTSAFAVLAHITRLQQTIGGYEIGAAFP
jgi:serine/threonine protein kinase